MAILIRSTNFKTSTDHRTNKENVKMARHKPQELPNADTLAHLDETHEEPLWNLGSCFDLLEHTEGGNKLAVQAPVPEQSKTMWNLNSVLQSLDSEPMGVPSLDSTAASSDDSAFASSLDEMAECSTAPSSPPDDVNGLQELMKRSTKDVDKVKSTRASTVSLISTERTKSHQRKNIIEQLLEISNAKLGKSQRQDPVQIGSELGGLTKTAKRARKDKARLKKQIIENIVGRQEQTDEEDECDEDLESDSTLKPRAVTSSSHARISELKEIINGRKLLTPASVPSTKQNRRPSPYLSYDLSPSFDRRTIQPMLYTTKIEKQISIAERLLDRFKGSSSTAEAEILRAVDQVGGNFSSNGIHVFVDSSNIAIGFANILKKTRGISQSTYVRQPPLAFDSLALIMERGRGVAKRELVGSSKDNVRPEYMETAMVCGYEVSALERVEKWKESKRPAESDIERFKHLSGLGGGPGYSSGCGSSSDDALATKVMTEQGVDEILHMKMLESIVDAEEPATMVLATGDANVAEYSPGFMKMVERALHKGWNVELVAWRESMSGAYRNKAFQKKWQAQFMIVELDDFQEDLLAFYTDNLALR